MPASVNSDPPCSSSTFATLPTLLLSPRSLQPPPHPRQPRRSQPSIRHRLALSVRRHHHGDQQRRPSRPVIRILCGLVPSHQLTLGRPRRLRTIHLRRGGLRQRRYVCIQHHRPSHAASVTVTPAVLLFGVMVARRTLDHYPHRVPEPEALGGRVGCEGRSVEGGYRGRAGGARIRPCCGRGWWLW
jgi:hypothetical protein